MQARANSGGPTPRTRRPALPRSRRERRSQCRRQRSSGGVPGVAGRRWSVRAPRQPCAGAALPPPAPPDRRCPGAQIGVLALRLSELGARRIVEVHSVRWGMSCAASSRSMSASLTATPSVPAVWRSTSLSMSNAAVSKAWVAGSNRCRWRRASIWLARSTSTRAARDISMPLTRGEPLLARRGVDEEEADDGSGHEHEDAERQDKRHLPTRTPTRPPGRLSTRCMNRNYLALHAVERCGVIGQYLLSGRRRDVVAGAHLVDAMDLRRRVGREGDRSFRGCGGRSRCRRRDDPRRRSS